VLIQNLARIAEIFEQPPLESLRSPTRLLLIRLNAQTNIRHQSIIRHRALSLDVRRLTDFDMNAFQNDVGGARNRVLTRKKIEPNTNKLYKISNTVDCTTTNAILMCCVYQRNRTIDQPIH